jgi:hypothetical protein
MIVLILDAASPQDTLSPLLLEKGGRLMVQILVQACRNLCARLVFAVRADEIARHRLDRVIALASDDAEIVVISGDTGGAACTALLCVAAIHPQRELLVLSGNEFVDHDFAEITGGFRARGLDAGIVTFPSIHPRYAHVRLEDGLVVEAAEKHPISHHACAGFVWYRRGADFLSSAQAMIRKDAQVDGRFFVSLTLNEMVLRGQRIGVHPIEAHQYHPLKSQSQMQKWEQEALAEESA